MPDADPDSLPDAGSSQQEVENPSVTPEESIEPSADDELPQGADPSQDDPDPAEPGDEDLENGEDTEDGENIEGGEDSGSNASSTLSATTTTSSVVPYSEEALNTAVQAVLDRIITSGMSQLEQARAVYNYTRGNISYVGTSDKSDWKQGAYTGLTVRRGDCFTYYAVARALLTALGIPNMEVHREGGTTHHFWNLVNCGNGWYHMDATPRSARMPAFNSFMFTDEQAAAYTELAGRMYYNFNSALYPKSGSNDPAPTGSDDPGVSEDPGNSDTPDVPENPDTPDVPENPDTPDVPENPDTPDVPENPDTPDVPENPDTPDVPENPDTPDVPENPDTPDVPENPDTPDVSEYPDNSDVPVYPDTPDVPEYPDNPGGPDASWENGGGETDPGLGETTIN